MNDQKQLLDLYRNDQRIESLRQAVSTNGLQLRHLTSSAKPLCVAESGFKLNLVICSEADDAPYFYSDLCKFLGENTVFYLPSSFKNTIFVDQIDAQNIQLRTQALSKLFNNEPVTVVAPASALSEKVITESDFRLGTFKIKVGDKLSISFLAETLGEYGFTPVDFVYAPGQYSLRGSIVDVFSFSNDKPYRIDFFGDDVDSIREFEIDSQLSKEKIETAVIVPDVSHNEAKELVPLSEAIDESCVIWYDNRKLCLEIIDKTTDAVDENEGGERGERGEGGDDEKRLSKRDFCNSDDWERGLKKNRWIDISDNPTNIEAIDFNITPQPLFKKNFDLLEDDIYYKLTNGYKVTILSDNSRQLERLRAIMNERRRTLTYCELQMTLHEGFVDNDKRQCYYTDHQIFERYHKYSLRNEKTRNAQQAITLKELSALNVGDYVVHTDHGIGIFGGLVTTEASGKIFEAIRLTFRDGDTLLVNIHSLHKISKYRGKEGIEPKINKLGTQNWSKLKEKTKSRVKDIARELIMLYAKRKEEDGFSFSADTYMQKELEASFLYEDTPDQTKASQAVKEDMEKSSPMDRLVCGDVGFGKTEVAIRAAFKAVADSKQAAVLVPTTVLAFQHYNTFVDRLKNFPVKIDYLSRLRKTSEIKDVIKRTKSGELDIIIGTHKLIGKDVEFKDLGLLIIDEEQRFGVGVKEKLRQLKTNVDTLTLTATPIPRTLQFSLMGARDLSILNTPPTNRQPIATEVHTYNEAILKEAILYEINRGGQVFLINNRISHLYEMQRVVQTLLPEIKTVIAHGQMEGTELESIMLDFIAGQYDVLLSTTIIESGLDIPNANTIIINNAHQFGLSELHQLRGRVGRSNKKAFCYLFAPPLSTLTQEARRRLKIIEEFSDLGSGFNIAMQDLDIRGTGDVLGAEQSGFISDIGFETYQRILSEALVELKQVEYAKMFESNENKPTNEELIFLTETQIETDEELIFPEEYISSIPERMKLYKELDNIQKEEDIEIFRQNLIDRFGNLPQTSEDLLDVVRIRIIAMKLAIEKIVFKNHQLRLYFISNENSAFFSSPIFTSIINWIQKNPSRVTLKEVKGKLLLSTQNEIGSMQEVKKLLTEITNAVS